MEPAVDERYLTGATSVRTVSRWGFPRTTLIHEGEIAARLGRTGWFKIFFGKGQQIEPADGTKWRLRSIDIAGDVCPVIVDETQRKIALASPLTGGGYGINGKNFAHVLYPSKKAGLLRENNWILRDQENDLATVTRKPLSAISSGPIHIGSLLLAFALVRFGLPSEKKPALPAMKW